MVVNYVLEVKNPTINDLLKKKNSIASLKLLKDGN